MAERALKIGSAVLCSYISRGQNGKVSLIDVYGGDILVNEFPARLTLAVYGEIFPDPETPQTLDIEFLHDGVSKAKGQLAMDAYGPGEVALVLIEGVSAHFEKAGDFKVQISATGYSPVTLVRKQIAKGDLIDPNA